MTDWKEITDPEELFRLKREGWEIEFANSGGQLFAKWSGLAWHADRQFHARPRQPKMKKVKSQCWRNMATGNCTWAAEHCDMSNEYWQRFPAGDIEGEVPE